jgi:biopolymer transport protein ExbB/biopolymer transport protein TolQ
MGIIQAVVVLLFLLAWSLGVMIDRALRGSAARKQSRVFAAGCRRGREGKLDEAIPSPSATRRVHRQGGRHRLG